MWLMEVAEEQTYVRWHRGCIWIRVNFQQRAAWVWGKPTAPACPPSFRADVNTNWIEMYFRKVAMERRCPQRESNSRNNTLSNLYLNNIVRSSFCGAVETKSTRNHEIAVQSLDLLNGLRIWHCHELRCSLQMQLRSQFAEALAGSYSSDSTPTLGTSICH